MSKKNIWIGGITLLLLGGLIGGYWYLTRQGQNEPISPNGQTGTSTAREVSPEARQTFEEFIRKNISQLSPQKEVLGGKFYITKIEHEEGGSALVEYEDGHIAVRARVRFEVNEPGKVEIKSFEILPQADLKGDQLKVQQSIEAYLKQNISDFSEQGMQLQNITVQNLKLENGTVFFQISDGINTVDAEGKYTFDRAGYVTVSEVQLISK